MRMNHPMWPVVRESARRILRNNAVSIVSRMDLNHEVIALSNIISENIPERITFPEYINSDIENIQVFCENDKKQILIVQIGGFEPSEDVCWVNLDLAYGFKSILHSCVELLEAGYPGCIGCGGSVDEERWDEKKFRTNQNL